MRKTFKEFVAIIEKKENELRVVKEYLSEEGKTLYNTLNDLIHHLNFCRNYEDVFEDEDITEIRKNPNNLDFIRSMNFFLHNIEIQ